MVLSLIAYYIIYKDHSESAVGFLVLSIFVAPAIPFILFSMRNKEAHSLGGGHGGGQRQIGGYYGGGQPAAGGGPAYGGGGGRGGKVVGVSGMYKGAEFPIQSGEELLIGRDSAISHIIIDQGAENISRKHCGITYDPGNRLYHVTDYSSNGTFKEDGTRLLTNVTSALPIGSLIILGTRQTSFRLG
ncbi:MAG: FHA domain-containing protein, partial [Peptococcaceae bacterium]|jgi:hypothetical protein|nr:FHA domain-containing protein [Peptococcaceae bacterium]